MWTSERALWTLAVKREKGAENVTEVRVEGINITTLCKGICGQWSPVHSTLPSVKEATSRSVKS